jgi:methyl-accepting chemotaxis protein
MSENKTKIIPFPQHRIDKQRSNAASRDSIRLEGNEYRQDLRSSIKAAKRIFSHPEALAESVDDLRVSQYVLASLQDAIDKITTEIANARRSNPEWAMELGQMCGEVQSCLSELSDTIELILNASKRVNRTTHSQFVVQSRSFLDSLKRLSSAVEVIPFPISRYADGAQLPPFDVFESRSLP